MTYSEEDGHDYPVESNFDFVGFNDHVGIPMANKDHYTCSCMSGLNRRIVDTGNTYCGTPTSEPPFLGGIAFSYCRKNADIPIKVKSCTEDTIFWVCRDCFKSQYLEQYLFNENIFVG